MIIKLFIRHFFQTMIYLQRCRNPFWQQKGGVTMDILISFFVSVMASIVSYYICKWLDGNK